jgi:hypothetical protein
MDLRSFCQTHESRVVAASVLAYQPFIISDDLQTGVGYSWLHTADPRVSPPLVFERAKWEGEWEKISAANARLRATYDGFLRFIAERYPGASLFDVACNNGYFPVRAQMFGMGRSFGMDAQEAYATSVGFLNILCGTQAGFFNAAYDPTTHTAPISERYDVVTASAIQGHVPDPMHFIAFLARLAKEAIFIWECQIDSDELLISYKRPFQFREQPALHTNFPYGFNHETRMSRGMMEFGLRSLGFGKIEYLPWQEDWLPPYVNPGYTEATLDESLPPGIRESVKLHAELRGGSRHIALLARRG